MGIKKSKIDAEFASVEKNPKKNHTKSYRPKTFAHSNKSQKLHFSVPFSLITFFA
jgi:hypothetical protein